MLTDRKEIIDAISREEALLAELDRKREKALSRIKSLQAELQSHPNVSPAKDQNQIIETPSPKTSAEKVALFRSLFRGQEDVFPRLWVNTKTGKKGYAPACTNDWMQGVCGKVLKPPVKCGSCPNQAFISVSDHVILEHLKGHYVAGVYPLLPDDTCHFLAMDFDKHTWMDDVSALRDTCRLLGLSAAVERSRSGKGAHVWFFFAEPVAADVARKIGAFIITETMSRRHQLSMESYDRLFPNQDMMPKGGFGNLIALPFQHEPRQEGNTVFVDDNFVPYKDQWAFLLSMKIIAIEKAQQIADEATRNGQVLGVSMNTADDEDAMPWARSPSRRHITKKVTGQLPEKINIIMAQRLFVEKAGLPPALINLIKRVAVFQNPEFYKKQKMRLSTAMTPRMISCFEEHERHIALPRGCLDDLGSLINYHGVSLVIDDERYPGAPLGIRFQGQLSDTQEQAVKELLKHDIGIFVAPPGSGKTVIGAYLAAARARSTLVLVHRKPLLDQWIAQLSLFLGIDPKSIGQLGANKRKLTGQIDVAMIQSLVRHGEVSDVVAKYGHVIIDECHHLPAVSFDQVLAEVKARYITGLTATPYRRDGHQPIILMQCGPIRYSVSNKNSDDGILKHRLICQETGFTGESFDPNTKIQEIYGAIASDEHRNQLILNDITGALQEGRSPIVLTERKDHVDSLANKLRGVVRHLVVLKGGLTPKSRREVMERLSAIPEDEERLIIATGRYIGEGFDDARLDTLFLAMPFSWKGTLVQYAGRLHRMHPGKQEVRIYDYVDRSVPMLARMFEKRLKGFRAIGYAMDAR